jgi:galactitol-specific phosphotransferase system IIB component
MASEFNEDMFDNFEKPIQFKQKLETLKSQLPPILDDFKKYYVFFNKNPGYPEYEQMFQNMKSNLNKINSDLFTLSNDIQSNTEKINQKLFALDILIRREKEKNKELKVKLGIVENKNAASSELISNYKEMYESGYLRNWALFLSIVIAGFTIAKVYKKT